MTKKTYQGVPLTRCAVFIPFHSFFFLSRTVYIHGISSCEPRRSWISVGEPLAAYACFEQNSGGVSPNHSVLSLYSRAPANPLEHRTVDSLAVTTLRVSHPFVVSSACLFVQQHPWNEDSGKGKQRCSFS